MHFDEHNGEYKNYRGKLISLAFAFAISVVIVWGIPHQRDLHVVLSEESSLCASQAVKLDDCIPKPRRPEGKYSPYVVNGKPVTWDRIKEVIATNPTLVLKHVQKRTEEVKHRLNDLDSKEIIEHEAVLESERRIRRAKRRLEEISAKLHAKPSQQNAPMETPAPQLYASEVSNGADISPATQALVTAMATTMAAEQHEIDELRRRLAHLSRSKHRAATTPKAVTSVAVNVNATCAKACQGLIGPALSRCSVDCRALAALSVLGVHTTVDIATQAKAVPTIITSIHPPKIAATAAERAKVLHQEAKKGGRSEEDEQLARQAQREVLMKEQAKLAGEERKLEQIRKMKTWTKSLEHGGLKTLGYHEYGVENAMKAAEREKEESVEPRKMHLQSQTMAKQMAAAGVSKHNLKLAFGNILPTDAVRATSASNIQHGSDYSASTQVTALGGVSAAAKLHLGDAATSVNDLKALSKVGHISATTKARAIASVDALIRNPHAKLDYQDGNRKPAQPLKISIYPGSTRPLRVHLNPTSIAFWKKLDNAGVDVRP